VRGYENWQRVSSTLCARPVWKCIPSRRVAGRDRFHAKNISRRASRNLFNPRAIRQNPRSGSVADPVAATRASTIIVASPQLADL
jgi:hypothetical protein